MDIRQGVPRAGTAIDFNKIYHKINHFGCLTLPLRPTETPVVLGFQQTDMFCPIIRTQYRCTVCSRTQGEARVQYLTFYETDTILLDLTSSTMGCCLLSTIHHCHSRFTLAVYSTSQILRRQCKCFNYSLFRFPLPHYSAKYEYTILTKWNIWYTWPHSIIHT